MTNTICLVMIGLLATLPLWAQAGSVAGSADNMYVPGSTDNNSVAFTSELERSNYLKGSLSFEGAYDDNIFTTTPALADESYTISPSIALNINRSRLRWDLSYDPGFIFYQRFSSFNDVNQNFSTNLK